MTRIALLLLALLVAPVAAALTPVKVRFDSLDIDAFTRKPVRIEALWYAPPGGARRGAVIALHGCGGLWSSAPSRAGQPTERHEQMAELLVAEGYAVLFPDSLGSRGVKSICTVKPTERTINAGVRRRDVLGALAFLRTKPDVDPARIALLGWSHGGSTTLATMNARDREVRDFRADAAPYFATAIAFYPGCAVQARNVERWAPAAPLTIFIGGADDWTPAAPCVALGDAMAALRLPLTVKVYPGAYHDFDSPGLAKRTLSDVPSGVDPARGVTIAGDPAARADSYAKVKSLLRAAIGGR